MTEIVPKLLKQTEHWGDTCRWHPDSSPPARSPDPRGRKLRPALPTGLETGAKKPQDQGSERPEDARKAPGGRALPGGASNPAEARLWAWAFPPAFLRLLEPSSALRERKRGISGGSGSYQSLCVRGPKSCVTQIPQVKALSPRSARGRMWAAWKAVVGGFSRWVSDARWTGARQRSRETVEEGT